MKRSQFALLAMFGSAGIAVMAISACSSDSSENSGTSGSGAAAGHNGGGAGKAGAAAAQAGAAQAGGGSGGAADGQAGAAGEGGAHVAGMGGRAAGASGDRGEGGTAGEGGAAGDKGQAGSGPSTPCGPSSSTKPTVPTDIQVADSAVLVAAFAAVGTQTYTCQQTGTGVDATYAWSAASVPTANLYGSDCALAATHYAGPHWKANDGSIILGAKVRAVASSTAASIPQLILSAAVDAGSTGIFTPVTAVQRLDTVAGIAPSTGCDAAHVNSTVDVPYTATYYFYSGSNIIP